MTINKNETEIIEASLQGDLLRASLILDQNPELINLTDSEFHQTPLQIAISLSDLEFFDLLLSEKYAMYMDFSIRDTQMRTAFDLVNEIGDKYMIEKLSAVKKEMNSYYIAFKSLGERQVNINLMIEADDQLSLGMMRELGKLSSAAYHEPENPESDSVILYSIEITIPFLNISIRVNNFYNILTIVMYICILISMLTIIYFIWT